MSTLNGINMPLAFDGGRTLFGTEVYKQLKVYRQ